MDKIIATANYRMIINKKIIKELGIMFPFFNETKITDSVKLTSMLDLPKRRYSV